jgi:hypothetical protein
MFVIPSFTNGTMKEVKKNDSFCKLTIFVDKNDVRVVIAEAQGFEMIHLPNEVFEWHKRTSYVEIGGD